MPTVSPQFNGQKKLEMSEKEEMVNQITDLVTDRTLFCTKEVLTTKEAARYMGLSLSYLYKLTMGKQVPHYKPLGKLCYFNRRELEAWLQTNRYATEGELTAKAEAYTSQKGGVA